MKQQGASPKPVTPQITGNVGLYYCCYHLSRLGLNVMPTTRNARGIDLITYDQNGIDFRTIQVKTLSKRNPVALGKSIDTLMGQFWVIVNKAASDSPCAFILKLEEVRALAGRFGEGERAAWWLDPLKYEQDRFRNAWTRIQPHVP